MKVREAREREKSHILLTGSHKSQTAAWQDYVVKYKSARVCVCMCVYVRACVCNGVQPAQSTQTCSGGGIGILKTRLTLRQLNNRKNLI